MRPDRPARDIRQLTVTEESMAGLQLSLQGPDRLAEQAIEAIEPDASIINVT